MAYITQQDLENFEKKFVKAGDTSPQNYCEAAMEIVAQYLGYDPEKKHYTTVFKGDCGKLATMKAPIIELTGFMINGVDYELNEVEFEDGSNYICFVNDGFFQRNSRYTFSYYGGLEPVPGIIKTTALQIASLLWESGGGNLAVSSTSFADTGSRVFNNFTVDRFLTQIAPYKRETK